jgi:hypothetical protein
VGEEGCVPGSKLLLILRQFVNRMKGIGGANRDTGSAMDAAFRVDVKLSGGLKTGFVLLGVNAVARADVHARRSLMQESVITYAMMKFP